MEGEEEMNAKTLLYIVKRIGLAILTVWVVITITFFVMRAVPGGPFMGEKAISPAAQAALELSARNLSRLRQAVVMAEILDKPKALRRYYR